MAFVYSRLSKINCIYNESIFCVATDSVVATAGYNGLDWIWVGIHMVIVDWIGLGQSASGLGWIVFSKIDPCPTQV